MNKRIGHITKNAPANIFARFACKRVQPGLMILKYLLHTAL